MLASTGNVRRNDGFTGDGSIFFPAVIDYLLLDSPDGYNVSPLGLTSFPPNKDGDDYGGQHDIAEQERDEIVVLPQPSRGGLRNS